MRRILSHSVQRAPKRAETPRAATFYNLFIPQAIYPYTLSSSRRPFIGARCLHNTRSLAQSSSVRKSRSAYDLFPSTLPAGPPPTGSYNLDLAPLRREFLRLQAAAHPDRHSNPADKVRAEATSAALNDAYRTLCDPLLRARHVLLVQAGMDLEGDEGAKEQDAELLGVVLDARETIEEAEAEEDLEELRLENEERIDESERVLGEVFGKGEWKAAKREAVKLRYWVNVRQSIREWEPGKPVVLVH